MRRTIILFGLLSLIINVSHAQLWLGADISGTTALEARGVKLYNASGAERENTALMKELGLNAVRLRVWVNPKDGFCSKEDVLKMALRAKQHNMALMVDFHYSDWWADPGQQNIPQAWKSFDYPQMKQALARHTSETLSLLKQNSIDVKWVQVGNETTHGFLWDMGRAETNMAQYAGLTQAGYDAVKSVYPDAQVIIHLDGGCDSKRYNFIFDGLRQYGAKWDMIGMSLYPYWDREAGMETAEDGSLSHCIDNINALYKKYGTELMIVETGYEASRPEEGYKFMKRLIDAVETQTNGHCKGIFYWAPELEGHYKLGAFQNHRPTKIMQAFTEAASKVTWDSHSLIIGGKRVVPAMGEVHYSRIPAAEWKREVRKMKDGGITMIACYVFWNHIEEIEGQFDWSGQRNLREFLEICKEEGLPVVLRIGPFCHGEVRCGGIPDWVLSKGCKTRTEDSDFLKYVEYLYRQIFTQVQGLQWKDGGPVIAAQFDNEFGGPASYLLTLKRIAKDIGYDLPFYTYTGWPGLSTPLPFGEMIPLYGDYADGFWDRTIEETAGEYYKAFNFREQRTTAAIGSEQLDYSHSSLLTPRSSKYPYFTCELGGGMMPSYHRRVYLYPEDAYSMAVVKLGSGSNLLGYYMYHGGTNPDGKLGYLNEKQATPATNWNDLPVMTYDFQAPLNEFGLRNPHFYMLRKLHLFMQDYGEVLAPMDAVFPCSQDIPKGDDTHLRWSYRQKDGSGFVFINNYERLQCLSTRKNVRIEVCGVKFPALSIPAGVTCIFPVNIDGIKYATAQIIAKRNGNIYLEQIKGVPTEISINGKVLKGLKPQGTRKPVYKNIYLLTSEEAGRLFLTEDEQLSIVGEATFSKQCEAKIVERNITIGVAGVAEEPVDDDFKQAAVYTINLPKQREGRILDIDYRGDVARLYADGKLIDDNFYNGRHFQYALWRVPACCKQLELRILPIQKDMPVYFPREADSSIGEKVNKISILSLKTNHLSLVPKKVWTDVDGNPINAHGGGMLFHQGIYYWYGEYKTGKTKLLALPEWDCYRTDVAGVSCYSSKDLHNWKFEGVVLKPEPNDTTSDLHPSKVVERPKVIYNKKTKKFVMWVHADSADYGMASAGVAVADSPIGPFTYLGSFRPNGAMSRDQTLFVDDDGTAYQICSSENNMTLHINRLTDDYLKPDGCYVRSLVDMGREAPAVFKYKDRYYMLTSGCSGWDPNQAELAVADSMMGEWNVIGNPCVGPDADKTFYGQSTYILPTSDGVVACFDLWNKTNLADSRYLWLPITIDPKTDSMTIQQ